MPFVWWLSRIAEEFHCLPSEAWREWREAPCGLIEDLLEAGAYAHAKHVVDTARTAADIPAEPLYALVHEIEFALVKEARDAAAAEH